MYRTLPVTLFLLLSLAMTLSCSTNLQRVDDRESSYILALRAEYFASNPDGKFNEYIERGEIVKGMDMLEVLASWGYPAARKRSETTELWTYREVNEDSKDWIEFTFTFRSSVLGDWEVARHYGGGSLDFPETRDVLLRGEYSSGKRVP